MSEFTYTLKSWDNSYILHDRGTLDEALATARQTAKEAGSLVKIIDHECNEGLDVGPDGSVCNWYDATPLTQMTDRDLALYDYD